MTGVCFYGVPSSSVADPRQARCPLQLHFANLDDAVGFSDPKVFYSPRHFGLHSPRLPMFWKRALVRVESHSNSSDTMLAMPL